MTQKVLKEEEASIQANLSADLMILARMEVQLLKPVTNYWQS